VFWQSKEIIFKKSITFKPILYLMNILEIFSKDYLFKKSGKLFDKGYIEFEKGNYQKALDNFLVSLIILEKANIGQSKKNELIVTRLIFIAQSRGKIEQFELAEQDLIKALTLKPEDIGIYWSLGSLKLDQNKFEEGVPLFEKMIELNPLDPNGYFFRGACMLELGKYKDSIPDFEKSFRLDPKNDNALVALGDAHQELQEFGIAVEFYDKAISLNDRNSAAFVNRGNCKVELGLHIEGCEDYHRALELGDRRVQENIDEYCKKQ